MTKNKNVRSDLVKKLPKSQKAFSEHKPLSHVPKSYHKKSCHEKYNLAKPKKALCSLYEGTYYYKLLDRKVRFKVISTNSGQFGSQWHVGDKYGTITYENVKIRDIPEYTLHELTELAISDAIMSIFWSDVRKKVHSNIAHFLTAYTLNEYRIVDIFRNPIREYVESDFLPCIKSEKVKESFFGKQKSKNEILVKRKEPQNRFRILKGKTFKAKTVKRGKNMKQISKEVEILSVLASNGFSRAERVKYLKNIRLSVNAEWKKPIKEKEVK